MRVRRGFGVGGGGGWRYGRREGGTVERLALDFKDSLSETTPIQLRLASSRPVLHRRRDELHADTGAAHRSAAPQTKCGSAGGESAAA
eukprot:366387-Chlamydomonas_euryale.AAC.7